MDWVAPRWLQVADMFSRSLQVGLAIAGKQPDVVVLR